MYKADFPACIMWILLQFSLWASFLPRFRCCWMYKYTVCYQRAQQPQIPEHTETGLLLAWRIYQKLYWSARFNKQLVFLIREDTNISRMETVVLCGGFLTFQMNNELLVMFPFSSVFCLFLPADSVVKVVPSLILTPNVWVDYWVQCQDENCQCVHQSLIAWRCQLWAQSRNIRAAVITVSQVPSNHINHSVTSFPSFWH